ncbi:MAG: radical SAM protein [Planctomycetota bacterium]
MDAPLRELRESRAHTGQPFAALCYAPFAQLHFEPDGTISACSKSVGRVLGRVGVDRIVDVWRSAAIAGLRTTMRDFRFPAGCGACSSQLELGNVANNPLRDFDPLSVVPGSDWPTRLEFAFSDLCNLACVHCSPRLSSVLRVRAGLPKPPKVYDDAFFAELAPLLAHVHQVSFLGGEPLLQPEVHRVVEMLIAGGQRPGVFVTTNGTVLDERIERWFDALHLRVSVSLDGVTARTFERIRAGAGFARVMANVERLHELQRRRGRPLHLNFCVMRANWRELPDFLLLAQRLDATIWFSVVTEPIEASVLSLPPDGLRVVHRTLAARTPDLATIAPAARTRWQALLDSLVAATHCPTDARQATVRRRHEVRVDRVRTLLRQRAFGAMARAIAALDCVPDLRLTHDLRAAGQQELAMSVAARVPFSAPDGPLALVLRAEHALAGGALDHAEQLLAQAAQTPAPPPDLHLRLAWLWLARGRHQDAAAAATRLAAQLALEPQAAPHLAEGLQAVRAFLSTPGAG